jgi:hypothetical protein
MKVTNALHWLEANATVGEQKSVGSRVRLAGVLAHRIWISSVSDPNTASKLTGYR